MDKVSTAGTMEACIMANGKRIRSKGMGAIIGSMVGNTRESGKRIICTEWESIPGRMAAATWVNTKMTKNTDTEFTSGKTEDFT